VTPSLAFVATYPVLAGIRRAILAEDPNLPITVARPLGDIVDRMMQDKVMARLSIAFGVVALLLSAIGLYGVLSYGVAAGCALSAFGTRLIASRLYGLAPTNPMAFSVAVAVLSAVALAAAWFPAHRASRVDPLVAFRYE